MLCTVCNKYKSVMEKQFSERKNQLPVEKKCKMYCFCEFLQTSNVSKQKFSLSNFQEF